MKIDVEQGTDDRNFTRVALYLHPEELIRLSYAITAYLGRPGKPTMVHQIHHSTKNEVSTLSIYPYEN